MIRPYLISAALILAAGHAPAAAAQNDPPEPAARMVLEVQQLREEVRELRGMVENQERELENLRRRQRDQYMDLDRRLQQAGAGAPAADAPRNAPGETGDSPAAAETPRDTPPARTDVPEVRPPMRTEPEITVLPSPAERAPRDLGTPTEEEQAAYDQAFRALRETRYADAAEGFDAFLRDYPDSAYAPNAQYWLAEVYYVTRDFETAQELFTHLIERYPGSNKEGDALLKIGFSHYELKQWPQARAALEQVRNQYPGTTLARLAENRLRNMRLEGHY